jgi:serine/threonine protein kinase
VSLTTGTRLGPYEIVAPIGEGGMGEVYKATDTRLDRTVAIKVLSGHLAGDPDLRERFDREARAISALNHPNICALYDVGHQNDVDFLVMEYLEGEPLSTRLQRGGLPIADVLRYGTETASALDKAHRAGIVHRDLKPGNVVITKSGAKLLDFGLAKRQAMATAPEATALATTPPELTVRGSILGTFQYMAPEQLEGADADARSDIFALGAVLYEMATGRKAFEGKTQASLIAAILERQPPPITTL